MPRSDFKCRDSDIPLLDGLSNAVRNGYDKAILIGREHECTIAVGEDKWTVHWPAN
jgi:hypothetical protein